MMSEEDGSLPMTCHEFRDALQDAFDRRSELSGPARQHAETCADHACRLAVEDFRLIAEACRSVSPVESPELVDRVLAALAPVPVSRRPALSVPVSQPRRAGSRSTVLSLVTVAGVLVAAFLGLRPRTGPDQVARHPASDPPKPSVVSVHSPSVMLTQGPEAEPFLPLHLAVRAPALVTDTVNGHFSRTAITELPVVTPLMSAVTEQFRPMGQELKEWVDQFRTAPEKMMDSTQVDRPGQPIG